MLNDNSHLEVVGISEKLKTGPSSDKPGPTLLRLVI